MSGRLKRSYSLDELTALAPIDVTLSVTELPRFVEALNVPQLDNAQVRCRLEFDTGGEQKVRVRGQLAADVQTECQRCLGGLALSIDMPVDWRLPDDLEIDPAQLGRVEIRLLDWIEDDLQLGIPLFARHADEQCGGDLAKQYQADDTPPDTITPFDGLKDLFSKH
ncbi:MAG: hypothetical protein AAF465_08350 [Pseudomonadota bacterium]